MKLIQVYQEGYQSTEGFPFIHGKSYHQELRMQAVIATITAIAATAAAATEALDQPGSET